MTIIAHATHFGNPASSDGYTIDYSADSHMFELRWHGTLLATEACYGDAESSRLIHTALIDAERAQMPLTRHQAAQAVIRTYPGAVFANWQDLVSGYDPIRAPWCVVTMIDGYGVHSVLLNGTLGALIERVRWGR